MTMKLASFSQTDEPKAFMSPGVHKGVVGRVVTCWYEVRAPETGEQPKDRMWNLQAALLGPLEGGCSTVRQEQTSFRPGASGVSADSFVFMQVVPVCWNQEQNESEIVRMSLSLQSVPIFSFAY